MADRNFCTAALLSGFAGRGAGFVIRQHAGLTTASAGTLRARGRTESGEVFEQGVTVCHGGDGAGLRVRRIVVRLARPTRDGDRELGILTHVPASVLSAAEVAGLVRRRWTLETMFQSLTRLLDGELAALGYPRAALLGFAVALATHNLISTVTAALRAVHGVEKVQEEASTYYIAA